MFSPYYALARSRGRGDPANHVAMNVALYGRPSRWAMTERGHTALRRDAGGVAIGPSSMRWDGAALTIEVEEVTCPIPTRLRGRVIVRPRAVHHQTFALDAAGRHRWRPIAPRCDVEVAFERPGLTWKGRGYFDRNWGDEPLEAAFSWWTWSRFDMGPDMGVGRGEATRIVYDVVQQDGVERRLSLRADETGVSDRSASVDSQTIGRGLWGVDRPVPADAGSRPRLVRKLEDAPFYTRSMVRSRIDGHDVDGVHESLSLDRLVHPVVRLMLPFRMPRRV